MSPARTLALALSLGTALACTPKPTRTSAPPPAQHGGLRPGDELDIRVFDEDRFNGSYTVADDGSLPDGVFDASVATFSAG